MEPKIIRKEQLLIAGIMGDGFKTAELWGTFDSKLQETELSKKTADAGYEVRFDYDGKCDCFVGLAVTERGGAEGFELLELPPREYAVFDVIVADGYDSENINMNKWLDNNSNKYIHAQMDGMHYVVESYNEKFKDGIVEIWIPLDAK
ncbi:AraC family transcriptional regulator [bacterium]|nr:AraC family transcriptional regulator [bacterium]